MSPQKTPIFATSNVNSNTQKNYLLAKDITKIKKVTFLRHRVFLRAKAATAFSAS